MTTKISIGDKFERLTVIESLPSRNRKRYYLCMCDCGTYKEIRGSHLTSNSIKSCGCLTKEINSVKNSTHRKTNTRLYYIWLSMKQRCYNDNYEYFEHYGGKGVIVCEEWSNNFMSFYEWSIDNGYEDDLSIDRINVDGNYTPSNCRWATMKIQQNNRSNNRYIEINGTTKTLSEWCEIYKVKYSNAKWRLNNGWKIEDVFEIT